MEATSMTSLQLQDDILKNLLLGLHKQSQFYVEKINDTSVLTEERKNFEKELSDINKVLTELSSKALSYTVQELDNLRTQFNNKLLDLNAVITDLEINTLKIEFNSLTPEQKQFLKGEKGDKGDKGLNPYEFAVMFGFMGTESDYLQSLKGAKGDNGLKGADGQNGINGKDFTFDMFTPEQLALFKGADGQNGINGKDFTYDMFTPEQLALFKGADGQNGINGKDFTYDMFTPEQLALFKGADGQNGINGNDGLSVYQIALNNGFVGSETDYLQSLKGANGENGTNGSSFTFDMFTPQQLQLIANLVTVDLSSINNSITALQNEINALNGSVAPTVSTGSEIINGLITSFVPTLANSKYYYDTDIVVPDNLTSFYNYYKFDFKLTDINNTYKVTFLVDYKSQVLTFVYDLVYNTEWLGWDIGSKRDLESSVLGQDLSFSANILNYNSLIFRVGFDCISTDFIAPFDFVCFIESDNIVSPLNVIEKRFDDDLPATYLWLEQ